MRMTGKTALVTGAGSGIGRATARLLAREGARVFLVGRRSAPMEEVAETIRGEGGEAHFRSADLRDAASVREAVRGAVEQWGALDVLVNSAGTRRSGRRCTRRPTRVGKRCWTST